VQGEKSKRAILDAAAKLMASRSYSATSIAAIVKACRLPASSIYWHFGSKQGLLAAVIERSVVEWERQLPHSDRLLPGKRPDLAERINNCAKSLRQKPHFQRLMLLLALERKIDSAASQILRRVHASIRTQLSGVIRAALDDDLTDQQFDDLSEFIISFMQGHFLSFQLDPESCDLEKFYGYLHQAVVALARQFAFQNADRGRAARG